MYKHLYARSSQINSLRTLKFMDNTVCQPVPTMKQFHDIP